MYKSAGRFSQRSTRSRYGIENQRRSGRNAKAMRYAGRGAIPVEQRKALARQRRKSSLITRI
jgi:hypothetical protein